MPAPVRLFTKAPLHFKGSEWLTQDWRLCLASDVVSLDANQDTFDFYDDITTEFATGGGYTVGGIALTGKTTTQDNTSNEQRHDAADVTWAALTLTNIRWPFLVNFTPGTAATRNLLAYLDLGANQSPAGIDFTVRWANSPSAAVFKSTV